MDLSERVERWLNSFVGGYRLDDFETVYGKDADETLLRDLIADWKRLRRELDDTRKAYEELHRMSK